MKRTLTLTLSFLVTLVAVAVVGMARPAPAKAQIWLCYDSYVLLNGRCPDYCPHGWDLCPCFTCINLV